MMETSREVTQRPHYVITTIILMSSEGGCCAHSAVIEFFDLGINIHRCSQYSENMEIGMLVRKDLHCWVVPPFGLTSITIGELYFGYNVHVQCSNTAPNRI